MMMTIIILERITILRITKDKKQKNHDRIVTVASELFRERGFDGVGVAELMDRAGLTHGGFYNHFTSKEDLITKACATSFGQIAESYAGKDALTAISHYLSREHRARRDRGCPAAALSCEAARQSEETKSAFAAGIEKLVGVLEANMAPHDAPTVNLRARAVSVFAQAVGAIILSRACPDDCALADEILDICRADCLDSIRATGPDR